MKFNLVEVNSCSSKLYTSSRFPMPSCTSQVIFSIKITYLMTAYVEPHKRMWETTESSPSYWILVPQKLFFPSFRALQVNMTILTDYLLGF